MLGIEVDACLLRELRLVRVMGLWTVGIVYWKCPCMSNFLPYMVLRCWWRWREDGWGEVGRHELGWGRGACYVCRILGVYHGTSLSYSCSMVRGLGLDEYRVCIISFQLHVAGGCLISVARDMVILLCSQCVRMSGIWARFVPLKSVASFQMDMIAFWLNSIVFVCDEPTFPPHAIYTYIYK